MDMSGWWTTLAFIPYINFVIGLMLIFKAGSVAENKFGDKPPKYYVSGLVL